MKKCVIFVSVLAATVLPVMALDMLVWGNRSPDMNAASSWNDTDGNISLVAPSAGTVLFFSTNAVVQPVLTASMTVKGLHFGASTNDTSANVVGVHPADGEGGYNYSGYRITGAPGATLTLDGDSDNKGWTRDVHMATKGTNSIAVPVVFTDNRAHFVFASGGRFVFEKPVSTHATSDFTVGNRDAAHGRIVFMTPNPDFAPKRLKLYSEVAIADPRAFEAVPKFYSDCWAWSTSVNGFASEKACHFINETSEPAVITASDFQLGDHDNFCFDGGPFPMTNTVYRSNMRGTDVNGTASVTVKEIVYATTATERTFDKSGSGTFVNLGGFCLESTRTNMLQVHAGAYVAMSTNGLSQYRNTLRAASGTSPGPRLAVNFDYAPPHSADKEGDLSFCYGNRPAGFAAVGGVRHVNLYGGALLRRGLKHPVLGGDWKQFAGSMGFGAEGTDGTVVLDNDIDLNNTDSNGECSVSVWNGDAFVDARFAGSVTNAPDSNPTHLAVRLSKKEAGVLALDGPCYVTSDGRVHEGGLLVNNTIACKYVVYDGAWIGGTGRTLNLEIQSGGGLRPGEQGGELEVSGAVSFADGAKIIADVGTDIHGCANFTGTDVSLSAAGDITVELQPVGSIDSGARVKILDWSAASPSTVTAFELSRYSVSFDTNVFSRARLSVKDSAMYLSYSAAKPRALRIFLK